MVLCRPRLGVLVMMMRIILTLTLLLPSALFSGESHSTPKVRESWIVVVNQNANLSSLSQKQVMSLFLGRAQFLPSGSRVKTIDYPVDSQTRADFYRSLTGKNIADIDAYWARLRYSGRASPPQALENSDAIMAVVRQQESALAYLPANFAGKLAANGLKAVLTVGAR